MQQEQYYKAVKASERLPESEDIQFRMIADKKAIDVYSYWSDTHLELNDADALGQPVGTLVPKTDVEWLEPIPLPDAAVLRSALSEIQAGSITGQLTRPEINRIAREALSAGDGWVRVEEGGRLPEDWDTYVWAVRRDNGEVIKISGGNITKYHFAYTHWQPERIPSPPIK